MGFLDVEWSWRPPCTPLWQSHWLAPQHSSVEVTVSVTEAVRGRGGVTHAMMGPGLPQNSTLSGMQVCSNPTFFGDKTLPRGQGAMMQGEGEVPRERGVAQVDARDMFVYLLQYPQCLIAQIFAHVLLQVCRWGGHV